MEGCEVCGRGSDDLFLVDIEGAQMMVCGACAKGKTVLQEFTDRDEPQAQQRAAQPKSDASEVVENYGRIIREAREGLSLPSKVLAERINEKESTLVRVEKEEALPDDRLARKLEKALGIRLIVSAESSRKPYAYSKQAGVTLGDAAVIKKGKKGS